VLSISPAVAALAGFVIGFFAAGEQYRFYREDAFQEGRARGRRLLVMRVALGLAMAVVLAIAWRPDHYAAGPALATTAILVPLLVLASTDFERKRLPNRLMYPAMITALALAWAWPDRTVKDIALGAGIAIAAGGGIYILGEFVGAVLNARVTPFGLGDVKLIVLIGLVCGWPAFLTALFIGAIAAGVPSLAMLLTGRSRRALSYGPYLIAGCSVVMLWPGRFIP
jgi:leader peptidase (prepilin peptidase)/N-methyltransferase